MLNSKFSPWPCFTDEEGEAVKQVLLSNKVNYWTGRECKKFEAEFAQWCHCKHAIALSNGTVALELALRAIGVQSGDEVITTPRTFIASASAIVAVGATPVFADVDLNSQNITAETIENVLSEKTKAIIVVHLAGMPAEMDGIMALAEKYNLKVIEDCAQAHGAQYKGRPVGAIGHIGAWSFCQDKIMTTGGEGGIVTTNDSDLFHHMWSYKEHGKSYKKVSEPTSQAGFRWLCDNFGTNWRMTEMQAAIGRIQLRKMPEWSLLRLTHAQRLTQALTQLKGVRVVNIDEHLRHAFYKYYFFVNDSELNENWDRDRIIAAINECGVPCQQGICPEIHRELAFRQLSDMPEPKTHNAETLGKQSVCLLVHPTLTTAEIDTTIHAVEKVMRLATSQ